MLKEEVPTTNYKQLSTWLCVKAYMSHVLSQPVLFTMIVMQNFFFFFFLIGCAMPHGVFISSLFFSFCFQSHYSIFKAFCAVLIAQMRAKLKHNCLCLCSSETVRLIVKLCRNQVNDTVCCLKRICKPFGLTALHITLMSPKRPKPRMNY